MIFAVPSNDTPPIVLALANAVDVPDAFPVTLPVKAPAKAVEVNKPVEGLYVKPVSISAPCVPLVPSTNTGYTVSSVLLLAVTVTFTASSASGDVPINAILLSYYRFSSGEIASSRPIP